MRRLTLLKLLNTTFIDPRTGARLHKPFTLHDLDGNNDAQPPEEVGETVPLLSQSYNATKDNSTSRLSRLRASVTDSYTKARIFAISDTGKGIFKCALAYVLGSLATFVPILSNILGRNDSKHLVATITVYFHPSRSLGSMLDALLLAFAAFLYTAIVSVISMSVSVFFADVAHLRTLGHAVVLVVFVGGGLGLVGWIKLKKNDPLVNIACSLTSLALITVLTKEGAVQAGDYSFEKIAQILRMIVAGVIATMLVSFLVFPISARTKLKRNMIDVTDSLADMLALIASSFLSGDEAELEDQQFSAASERHRKTFGTIQQNLKEAKYEHYLLGTERQAFNEARLAQCIQRIAQSIGGLRTAAAMQFAVVSQPNQYSDQRPEFMAYGSMMSSPSWNTVSWRRDLSSLYGSMFAPVPGKPGRSDTEMAGERDDASRKQSTFRTPAQIFELFIKNLGPCMRSLAFTLKEILDDLPYDEHSNYVITVHPKFKVSLERALDLYKDARKEALQVVYSEKDMDKKRPIDVEADWEEAAACCGHFSFSLLEVAEQIKDYLNILDELQLEVEEQQRGRTWSWLKFWKSRKDRTRQLYNDPDLADLAGRADDLNSQFSLPEPKGRKVDELPPSESPRSAFKRGVFRELYAMLSFLRRDDKKFAIKVGFGAMLYALPSFIEATRPIYSHWRGEWGLLSYMLVCSMTIGAANTTGYSRVLGTCMGAALAIAAWEASNGNPVILAFFGFCMAYWTAYIIIGQGKGPMGRFIMLTYNLSALYAYSLSIQDEENDGDEEDQAKNPMIVSIALHRVAAVISGCIWGLIITRVVWPISARQKLKDGLALLWLRMGLIWKHDPLTILTEGEHSLQYLNLRQELELQRFLTKLQGLIDSAKNEFELRRAFPHQTYTRILTSCGRMLDAFHAMNVVILKDMQASPGEQALLQATVKERDQLCSRMSHLFGVLASSMKLEYSLATNALPSTEHTRDRLLAKMFGYRKSDAEEKRTSDEDFSLLYTYALVTGQLGMEIQAVLKEVESLFGVLDEESLRLQ